MSLREFVQSQFRKRSRVYIMPTKMGGYLNGLIFLLFLLSVGYSNNLLLLFTLFLFGLNIMWVIQSHFHLQALKLGTVTHQDGHAGDLLPLNVHWRRLPAGPWDWHLELVNPTERWKVEEGRHGEDGSRGYLRPERRGLWRWTHLRVWSHLPFGLYQVWIYYPIELETAVFPRRLNLATLPPLRSSGADGEQAFFRPGPHDIWDLVPYQGGESRRISWKHYAGSGQLVVKTGEDQRAQEVSFTLPDELGAEKENLLEVLATQMVLCQRQDLPFTFSRAGRVFGPSHGDGHLRECLKELAKC